MHVFNGRSTAYSVPTHEPTEIGAGTPPGEKQEGRRRLSDDVVAERSVSMTDSTMNMGPAGSHSPYQGPPQPVIYVQTPAARGPGIFRTLFGAIGRLILTLLVVFIIVGAMVALATKSMQTQVVVYRSGASTSQVAIIDVDGDIDDDQAEFVRHAVNTVIANPRYRAVVLRVDSPGGGITASDHIWYEIKRLQQHGRTVVASYGSVAVSGGYYISCRADHIMAEPTTITGSIGVIASIMTFADTLEKLGIQPITLVAGESPSKNVANDIYRDWNDADRAEVQKSLDAAYGVFFSRVAERRQAIVGSEEQLKAVADGSIYTAEEAVANGLVDSIGYLDDAIDTAITMANLAPDSQAVIISPPRSPLDDLPFGLTWHGGRIDAAPSVDLDPDAVRMFLHELIRPKAAYLMP